MMRNTAIAALIALAGVVAYGATYEWGGSSQVPCEWGALTGGSGHDAVTIGTANGLSLSTQVLSLAAATNATPGAATAAQITALEAIDTKTEFQAFGSIDDLIALTGIADGTGHLGTFNGTTIADSSTIKTAFQELETAVESAGTGGLLLAGFDARAGQPPAASYATLDTHNYIPVLDFDADADESIVFAGIMPPGYGGGGITVTIGWMSVDQTSGACVWNAAFMSVTDDADDLDSKSFAAANAVTATTATAAGEVDYAAIAFTDGADMDSVAAGEWFRLIITRDADNASDTLTGDAELLFIKIVEN